jgi:thioredoxin-like negative regulator of GroEL
MNFAKGMIAFLCTSFLCNAEVLHISSTDQFTSSVLNSNKPAVVKVGAKWCPACLRAEKPFENISKDPQFAGVVFAQVDADTSPDIVQKYNVQSLPTFVYLNKGKPVTSTSGFSENLKNEISSTVSRMKSTGAEGAEPAMEKKTEEMAKGGKPEAKAETEASGTCQTVPENFLERAYNAVRDFFTSVADTVRGWFK